MSDFDIIVIGAGIGGLTAGALLAKKGYSVAVFEAQPQPGGCCTSFRRKGYTFDACLDAVSGGGENGWLRRTLCTLGVEGEVELVRLDPLRVDVFGGERVEIPADIRAFKELLYRLSPGERDGIDGLLRTMYEIFGRAMVTRPEAVYGGARVEKDGRPLAAYRGRSFKDLLDDFVKAGKARAVMSDRSAFMGLPPSRVSALAMTTMFMTFAVGGGYRIKGGARNLTGALVGALTGAGGRLYLKSPVTGIACEGGRAAGVFSGGERVSSKAVISAVDAGATCRMAGMDVPANLRPSVSFFMVYLGLGAHAELPDSMGIYPGYDIESTFSDIAADIASPRASVEIINYSRISPEMAPEGCTTLMLMSKASCDYAGGWPARKEEEAGRLIRLAGRAVPGLEGMVECSDAATPLTLGRYTGNASGAAFGWEQDARNMRSASTTPLPGLFMAGHWTYPGGGIESVAASGIVAAEKAAAVL